MSWPQRKPSASSSRSGRTSLPRNAAATPKRTLPIFLITCRRATVCTLPLFQCWSISSFSNSWATPSLSGISNAPLMPIPARSQFAPKIDPVSSPKLPAYSPSTTSTFLMSRFSPGAIISPWIFSRSNRHRMKLWRMKNGSGLQTTLKRP